jgi:tetratricopeptide (TPR) repeat protein
MLLKHIKKNRKYANQALAIIEQLQNASYDNNKEMQKTYEKVVNLLHATQLFEQALLSGLAGEIESAINAYTKALELNPEFSEAFYHRGSHYYTSMNNIRKALSDFNKAIKLNDGEASYFSSRGVCYYDLNNLELAIKDFNRVIELNPPDSILFTAFALRGNAYEEKGEDKKALQDYTRAIEINPKAVNIYYRKGLVNRSLENYEESVEDFCRVIELDEKYADAYHERGIAYAFLGDKQKVLDDFKSAARLGNAEAREFLDSKNIKWEEQ